MKITQEEESANEEETDSWGTIVQPWQLHLRGLFFETLPGSDLKFKLIKKPAIFFRDSVIYPFVQLEAKKKHFEMLPEEHLQITRFIENTCMASLPN